MNLKRLKLLWRDNTAARDGVTEEPSELRFRNVTLTLLLLIGPVLVWLLYYKTMFPGLVNSDALDYAQLGRNLAAGRGFITFILRPLALTHGNNPLAQPDVTHGPLYPFLLALAFGIKGANDATASMVSGVFYLLTIPVLYILGMRVFNRAVGLITALVFTFNALMLEYSVSGMHLTLYIFLMTCLLLVVYSIAAHRRDHEKAGNHKLPQNLYIAAGLLTALLYLTDSMFVWIVPAVLGAVYSLTAPNRRVQALIAFSAPMLLLMLPWMARNFRLTGNPIFGLRGMEIWMETKGHYPGYTAYRQFPVDLIPGVDLFKAVVEKILLGVGKVIQAFPEVTASWVLAFFLPCLLFRFADSATNALRRVMMYCFLGLIGGSLLFKIQMPLFVSVIPVMLLFSIAYLLHLTQQAQLRSASVAMVTTMLSIAVIYPLLTQMVLMDKTPGLKERGSAIALGKVAAKEEVTLSDQPWIVAWYSDRPALWLPVMDSKITDLRDRFSGTRWLFLTDQSAGYSPEWASVYNVFQRWNTAFSQAITNQKTINPIMINGKGFPLLEALNGFTTVPPTIDTTPSVVIAATPKQTNKIGMSPTNGSTTSH